jgi:large repetitive protein
MKNLKTIYTTFGILALWFVLMSYAANPPNGMTGAPTEGTCGNCHSGTTYNAGTVSMTGVPASIMPSTTYTVTVTGTSTAVKGGFQLCVLDGTNTNCGTLAATTTDVRVEGTTRKYAEHINAKSYVGGAVSWTFNWTSPATLSNTTIKFYYSTALCNGNNNDTGDTNKSGSFTGTLAAAALPVTASISATTNVTCNGASTGSATAAATGGTPPYTYAWSNGQNTQTASGLSAGTYIVTITGGAQSGTATATITQPTAINITTVSNNSILTCASPVASITVIAAGGTGTLQYAWSNGNAGTTLSATSAGSYTVSVTDANSCVKTSTFSVTSDFTPPNATATATNPVLGCNNTSTTLTATGGGTYNWSNGLGSSASVNVSPSTTSTYVVTVTGSNGCAATKSVTVTVDNTPPTATAIATTPTVTCSTPSTTLIATGGASYNWSNGLGTSAITAAVSPIANTTYTVIVTGANGCSTTQSVSVTVDKIPPTATAFATTPTVTCSTPSTTLTATGGGIYNWSNGLGTSATTAATVSPTANTTYTVTVTAVNGCSTTQSVSVTVDKTQPNASINASANTITCANPSATLTVTGGGTYAWSNGLGTSATTAAVSPTANTTYTATVTGANGCTVAVSKTIDVNTVKPNISLTPKTATLSCASASVALGVSSTTSGATFSWSGPGGFTASTANINAATPGKYLANAYNPINGCSAVDSAIVLQDANVPTVAVTNGSISCKKTSAALSATSSVVGSTFAWSGPNNFTATGASATVTAPGTYVVNVTAPNGCKAAANSVVGNNAQPIAVNAGLDTKVCPGASATLSAKSSCVVCFVTYQWTNTGGSITSATNIPNVTALGAGTYIVVAKDTITGCIGKDTVTVSNFQVPTAVAAASFQDCQSCADVKVTGAGAPYTYAWSNGATTAKTCNLTANTYTVTVTTADICKVTASATTTTPPAINVTSTKVTNATIGQTNGAIAIAATGGSGSFTYSWVKSGSTQVIGTTQNIANLGVGIYVVTVKDANGCSATLNVEIKGVVGTEDLEANRFMSVFPNPNDGHFNINLHNITTANLRILNVEGQLMLTQILETENNIDLSLLPKGMYFIQLKTSEKTLVKRIVIE